MNSGSRRARSYSQQTHAAAHRQELRVRTFVCGVRGVACARREGSGAAGGAAGVHAAARGRWRSAGGGSVGDSGGAEE